MAAQVALSLLVVNSAGLLVRTLQNLRDADLGFRHETMIQAEIDFAASGLEAAQVPDVSRGILDRISRFPGIMGVTTAHSGFGTGMSRTCCIVVEGHDHERGEDREVVTLGVSPGYFRATALPLVQGRDFLPHESTTDPGRMPKVVIASEEFVRRYVAGGSPLRRRIGWGDDPTNATFTFEIVGVAGNATYDDLRQRPRPLLYFPSAAGNVVLIRTSTRDDAVIAAMRREIVAVNRRLVITNASGCRRRP